MADSFNIKDFFMEEIEALCENREENCTKEDLFQAMKLVYYLATYEQN